MIRFKTLLTELKKIKRGFPHTIERSWDDGTEYTSHATHPGKIKK